MVGLKKYSTLNDVIQSLSNENKLGITYITGDNEQNKIHYEDLFNKASGILYNLQAAGLKRNDELVFQIGENKSFLYVYWACILGNIIPVPLSIGNNDEHKLKLFNVWKTLNNPFLITDTDILDKLETFAKKLSFDNEIQDISAKTLFVNDIMKTSSCGEFYNVKADDIAFIQFSSGSTGNPKGVVLTHENLLTNIYAIINSCNYCKNDKLLSWMPLTHDLGMIGCHLTPLVYNTDQLNMHTSLFIRRPTLWIKKASEEKVTVLQSPNFGYKYFLSYLKPEMVSDWDLSNVRIIFNGAEPISIDICNEFLDALVGCGLKRNSMFPVYGMAEASLGISFPKPGEDLITTYLDREFLSVGVKIREVDKDDPRCVSFVDEGYPITDCQVKICDDDGNTIDENTIGHIQIKGKNVTKGYYNNKAATEKTITSDGWLKTGDLGYIRNGRITVTGRAKDIIFINGINYYAHDLERIAEAVKGCETGKVAVCGLTCQDTNSEKVIAFVLFKKKVEDFIPIVKELRSLIKSQVGIEINDIIPVKSIPKTTSGKVQRFKLEEWYEKGEFLEISETIISIIGRELEESAIDKPTNSTEENLIAICKKIFNIERVGINDNFIEIGGNSLLITQVHEEIEKIYPGKVKVSDFYSYPTVSKLTSLILQSNFIEIERIKISEEHITNIQEENTFCEVMPKENLYSKLCNIAKSEDAETEEILLLLYMFSLSKAFGLKEITVQSAIKDKGKIVPITVDFGATSDISALIISIKDNINSSSKMEYYSDDIHRIRLCNDKSMIAPLFCKNNINANDLLDVYDIVLQINDYGQGLTLRSNGNKIGKSKLLMINNYYTKLLNRLAEKYVD